MDRLRRKGRAMWDGWERAWPSLARATGMVMLVYGVAFAPSADKSTSLGVAIALLSSPTVVGAQRTRNRRRDEDGPR